MRSVLPFFFCFALSGVQSAIYYDDQVEIQGHEGQCYDNDRTTFYNKDDVMKNESSECMQRICLGFLEEIGKLRIQTFTCPVVVAGPGCTTVQDPSKPYPDCCPQLVSMPSAHPVSCKPQKREQ